MFTFVYKYKQILTDMIPA